MTFSGRATAPGQITGNVTLVSTKDPGNFGIFPFTGQVGGDNLSAQLTGTQVSAPTCQLSISASASRVTQTLARRSRRALSSSASHPTRKRPNWRATHIR